MGLGCRPKPNGSMDVAPDPGQNITGEILMRRVNIHGIFLIQERLLLILMEK
jgi:hypothetical protein